MVYCIQLGRNVFRKKVPSYYSTTHWKHLARFVKKRDGEQCQICGDRDGDPYCVLHAHHIEPRAQGGPDIPDNVITLCDLCHAVVTRRWHKPWFGSAAVINRAALDEARQEYLEFLALDPPSRRKRQEQVWALCGIVRAAPKAPWSTYGKELIAHEPKGVGMKTLSPPPLNLEKNRID